MLHEIYRLPLRYIVFTMILSILVCTFIGKKLPKWLYWVLVFISFFGIFYFTLSQRESGVQEVILIPFYSFYEALQHTEHYRSMLMNVFLFFPLGLSLPFCLKKRNILYTVILGFLLSVFIEIIQYKYGLGRAEVDDVIMNTLGTFIGALGFYFNYRFLKRR